MTAVASTLNVWFVAAALVAAATLTIHIAMGGADTVKPLLASDLSESPRATLYLVWHISTAVLVAMALAFAAAALVPSAKALGAAATALSALFVLANVWAILRLRVPPKVLPQWIFFSSMAALGGLGIAK
ncbi:MAG: hypothetical protein AAF318_09575 [Pseudomonadota bacterium]